MFKAVGFSFDKILKGFMAMGHAYFEVLGNLTNKLFNWLLNLFDHKIVPNVPNTKPGPITKSPIDYILSPVEKVDKLGPIPKDAWNSINIDNFPKISLRDIYMKGTLLFLLCILVLIDLFQLIQLVFINLLLRYLYQN